MRETVCIQCANRRKLEVGKVRDDINKVLTSANSNPDIFRLVCGANVSAKLRDSVKAYAQAKGIANCDIWSGPEFEELLRLNCGWLLKRFMGHEVFPDNPEEMKKFVEKDAIEGQFAKHQQLFRLWRDFKNSLWIDELREQADLRVREWFGHDSLSVEPKLREEIRLCLCEACCFPGWRDRR